MTLLSDIWSIHTFMNKLDVAELVLLGDDKEDTFSLVNLLGNEYDSLSPFPVVTVVFMFKFA